MNDGDNIGGKKWRESKKWRDGHEQLQKIALLGASISDVRVHKMFGLFDQSMNERNIDVLLNHKNNKVWT